MTPRAQMLGGAAVACAVLSGVGITVLGFQRADASLFRLFVVLGHAAGPLAILALMEPSRLARDWFGWGAVLVLGLLVVAEPSFEGPVWAERLMDHALEATLLAGAWRVLHLLGRAPPPPLLAIASAWLAMVLVVTVLLEPNVQRATRPTLGLLLVHQLVRFLLTLAVLAFLLGGAAPWHGGARRWSLWGLALFGAAAAAAVASSIVFSMIGDPPQPDGLVSWWIGLSRTASSGFVASLAAGATALSLAVLQPARAAVAQPA